MLSVALTSRPAEEVIRAVERQHTRAAERHKVPVMPPLTVIGLTELLIHCWSLSKFSGALIVSGPPPASTSMPVVVLPLIVFVPVKVKVLPLIVTAALPVTQMPLTLAGLVKEGW